MENDFSKGGVGKNILLQAVPLTIAQLIQLLYNVVDRIYIGHLPGSDGLALTGIGLIFPIVSLVTAFTNLFGMGGAPLCSIARGSGEKEKAEKIMGNTFTLLFLFSFVIMAICYTCKRPILYAFGASADTYAYADEYLTVYLIGTPFAMLGTGMNYFINSQGFPRIGMLTTMVGAVLNILLDPLFIFVLGMGVRGAAIATVISQGASALWVLRFLTGKKAILRIRRGYLKPEGRLVRRITGLGMSGFIMSGTNSLTQVVCNVTLKSYGGDLYIGIMTILNSVREIISLPAMGITNGSQPVLGYNYGARRYDRVRRGILFTSLIAGAYSLAAWVAVILFPGLFIRLFSDHGDILMYGTEAMQLYFFGFVFMAFQFAGQSTFVALGKSKHAIFFSLLRKVFIVVPLTLWLPTLGGLGVNGVFVAEPISNTVGGLACFVTMLCTVWRRLGKRPADEKKRGEKA